MAVLEIKVTACLVFGSLIVFFMITWKRFVPAVCSYFWVMLIEYVLYTTVNSLSKWNWFRYVNLFSILDASQPFTVYWNLNLFSHPIWAEFAKMVLCIATILLCTVLSILIYCHEREGKRVYGIASGRRIAVCSLSGKHVSIFAHEGYKFYVLGGMGVFLIVAAVVSMRMAEGIPSHTGTTEIQAYRYYIEQLQGTYTEETRAWLEQETQIMQMTDQEAFEIQEQFQNREISSETYTDWMEKRQQLIEMRSRGFYKILAQEQVIKNAKENGFENAGFVDQYKLSYLFKDENNQMFLACVLLSALILGVSGLFGIEERNGMMVLLQSTKKGRQPLQRRKLLQTIFVRNCAVCNFVCAVLCSNLARFVRGGCVPCLKWSARLSKVACAVVHSSGICCDVCASLSDSSDLQHHYSSCYQCSKETGTWKRNLFLTVFGTMYFISLEGKSVWCERCRRPFAAAYFPKRTGHVVWCVLDWNAGGSRRQFSCYKKKILIEVVDFK